ncbi:MAG: hypothetical protein M3Q10_05100 [Chloroflexota bacterium]|nr:hypothetical protein [Chloroflexota bacterium]
MTASSPLDTLPPEYPGDLAAEVRAAVAASGRKLVALDDDPTGVQTVHDTAVLARWDAATLAEELRDPHPVCFVLTNSRSVPEADAIGLNGEIAVNLREAARVIGVTFALASRSDSTLRGHFPAETDALADALGGVDGTLLVPAFFEGGRYTIGDVHWVREGDGLVPAAETEFARDATFGYRHSDLREWVEEKTGGRIPAAAVASISLEDVRVGGPDRVAEILSGVDAGRPVVVNATSYRDLDVVVLGLLRAEAAGKRFLYRTGASFVRARAGLAERPLLSRADLLNAASPSPLPGLVVVGSHVRRTAEQLTALLALPGVAQVELRVPRVVDSSTRLEEIEAARRAASVALNRGVTPVVATSRELFRAPDPLAQLETSRAVSSALVEVVSGVEGRPGWVVGKGGITSSDVGTVALGARRAVVLGQVRPGIPVWRLGPETRFPGLPYVVFPGNVGTPDTLAEVVALLRGDA